MKKQLTEFYLDWYDNYGSVQAMAWDYELTEDECRQLIEIGRKYRLKESVRKKQIETKLLTNWPTFKQVIREYKFRAECEEDVRALQTRMLGDFYICKSVATPPDVTVILESNLSLPEIINLMRTVSDAHVMHQTVKPIEEYTGERDYDL